jgi:small-conductance mechanosensitive channel
MEEFIMKWLLDPTVGKLVAAFIGLLIISVVVRFVKRYLSGFIKDTDNRYRARKFVTLIGYFTGMILISTIFSDKLGGLTVAFGVAGAGIAFALQEVIASVAGWLAISAGNFYSTGDRIQLGGIMGDVIDIGILRTTMMECGQWVKADLYNGRIVRVANSFVFKEPVFNYSGDFKFLWDEIVMPVKFGCDYKLAKEIFHKVAEEVAGEYARHAKSAWQEMVNKYMIEDARVGPMITIQVTDNWMEFTIRYIVDYRKRRSTKDILFSRIIEEIDKTDGRVGIASTTLQLVDLPELRIRINDAVKRQGDLDINEENTGRGK